MKAQNALAAASINWGALIQLALQFLQGVLTNPTPIPVSAKARFGEDPSPAYSPTPANLLDLLGNHVVLEGLKDQLTTSNITIPSIIGAVQSAIDQTLVDGCSSLEAFDAQPGGTANPLIIYGGVNYEINTASAPHTLVPVTPTDPATVPFVPSSPAPIVPT